MHDEEGFLAAIRQTPADDLARLVYADWLDEQDDGLFKLKAAFIRLELRLAREPYSFGLSYHLRMLAEQLGFEWLVVISRPKIAGCVDQVLRGCPSHWSQLTPTCDPIARVCEVCQSTVRYSLSHDEARQYLVRGQRIALTLALGEATFRPLVPAATEPEREPLIERPRLPRTREERCPDRQDLGASIGDEPASDESPSARSGREPPQARRQKGRRRHRSIQRENWTDRA
jgi:uncharacterized protein (TIGR02996 family)